MNRPFRRDSRWTRWHGKCFPLLLGLFCAITGVLSADQAVKSTDKIAVCTPPCGKPCGTWIGTAEFLYWTAAQSELSYAIISEVPEGVPLIGRFAYIDFEWEPGLRVGGAYRFACSGWQLGAEFTYVQLRANGPHIIEPPGGTLYTTLAYPLTDNTSQARAGEKIQYYILDLLAKRPTCLGWATLSPFLGVRLAQIDQHLNYVYFGNPDPINNNQGSADLSFKGAGLFVGLEGSASLCKGLSLFGLFDTGVLAGRDNNRQRQDSIGNGIGPVRVHIPSDTGKAVFDLRGGIQWQWCRLTLKAGYEFHHWINVAQYIRFLDFTNQQSALPATHGHLSVHGLVLTAAYCL